MDDLDLKILLACVDALTGPAAEARRVVADIERLDPGLKRTLEIMGHSINEAAEVAGT